MSVNEKHGYFDRIALSLAEAHKVNLTGVIDREQYAHIENSLHYQTLIATGGTSELADRVTILMNSPGGSVIDGFAIYDAIIRHKEKVFIDVKATGACMSMATIILQAADRRQATANTQFLLHEVQYGNHGSMTDHEDQVENSRKLQTRLNLLIASRSKLSVDELQKLIKRKDHVITAKEALEIGLIDEIVL